MATRVDSRTADTIRWYLQERMTERGLHPSNQFEFGWGTVIQAAQEFKKWAEQTEHKFYAINSPLAKDGVPSDQALSQRIRIWLKGEPVQRGSAEDAKWIAKQIQLRFDKSAEPTTVEVAASTVEQTLYEFPVELEIVPPVPPVTINRVIAPQDNSLDSIRDLAKSFRDFGCASEDKELASIMANTELELLRLLSDRL